MFLQQTELPFCPRAVEPVPCSEPCSQEAAVVLLPIIHHETFVNIPEQSYGAKDMEPNPTSALATWNLSIDLNRTVIRPSYKQFKKR